MVKVSLIVPVYNCEDYLEQCIESILSQTFKDYELILINDGSKDKSREICEEYSKKDKRIRLINQENSGVSKSRQKGISIAKSKYIIFIDSDDYIEKNFIKNLYSNIIEGDIDIVCCNSKNFGLKSENPKNIEKEKIITNKIDLLEDYFSLYRYTYTLWGKIFKKSIFDNLRFPKMKYAEDTFLMLLIFQKIKKIKLIVYDGYNYRIQSQSASNTLDDFTKLSDILKRDKLACDICEKFNEQLKQKACKNFSNDLYALVVLYAQEKEKKELKKIYNQIEKYYNYIKEYDKNIKIKEIRFKIIKLFFNNKFLVKNILRIIYIFKRKR